MLIDQSQTSWGRVVLSNLCSVWVGSTWWTSTLWFGAVDWKMFKVSSFQPLIQLPIKLSRLDACFKHPIFIISLSIPNVFNKLQMNGDLKFPILSHYYYFY